MPEYSHQVQVNVPIQSIWDFVSKIDNWAPLVPGYIEHNIINEKESTWSFTTNIGIMRKKIDLKVNITNWQGPELVTFNLLGLNEKFTGHGYFRTKELEKTKNIMTGFLDITAEGLLAKMGNSILDSNLPEMTTELTEAVAAEIEKKFACKN